MGDTHLATDFGLFIWHIFGTGYWAIWIYFDPRTLHLQSRQTNTLSSPLLLNKQPQFNRRGADLLALNFPEQPLVKITISIKI